MYQGRSKPVTRGDDDNNAHILMVATEHEDITVLWHQVIQRDREVLANRSYIIVKNKDKTCLLIYVAIPSDKNVIQMEAER
jgi:hypothetical protein